MTALEFTRPAACEDLQESPSGHVPIRNAHGVRRLARNMLNGRLPEAHETYVAVVEQARGRVTFRVADAVSADARRQVPRHLRKVNRRVRQSVPGGPRYLAKSAWVHVELIDVTKRAAHYTGFAVGQIVRLHVREAAQGFKLHLAEHPRLVAAN